MKIVSSPLYEEQLKSVLGSFFGDDIKGAKSFKLYLDTIILNMPTKVKKYKKSIFFDNENIKDIEHQGFTIPFFVDDINNTYVVLGIISNINHNS
ncbi:hypothetical protein [Sulfurimonas sp. HSL3-2]|uniref:hypothetical protein n=1 Tax=Hydrocurvibacter mobilis TaxID=3131936 RepID=UPI0031F7F3FA